MVFYCRCKMLITKTGATNLLACDALEIKCHLGFSNGEVAKVSDTGPFPNFSSFLELRGFDRSG